MGSTELWMSLWTVVWFFGLVVFSLLSVLIIIFGGFDLMALLKSLRKRHGDSQEARAAESAASDTLDL
jgi:hypothetical protein